MISARKSSCPSSPPRTSPMPTRSSHLRLRALGVLASLCPRLVNQMLFLPSLLPLPTLPSPTVRIISSRSLHTLFPVPCTLLARGLASWLALPLVWTLACPAKAARSHSSLRSSASPLKASCLVPPRNPDNRIGSAHDRFFSPPRPILPYHTPLSACARFARSASCANKTRASPPTSFPLRFVVCHHPRCLRCCSNLPNDSLPRRRSLASAHPRYMPADVPRGSSSLLPLPLFS